MPTTAELLPRRDDRRTGLGIDRDLNAVDLGQASARGERHHELVEPRVEIAREAFVAADLDALPTLTKEVRLEFSLACAANDELCEAAA